MNKKSNKKVLILHGWEGNPELYWFPKAKKKLEALDFEVFTPQMPGGYFPKKEEWLRIVEKLNPDVNWILIGHSLGGVAILKYLETADKPVFQTILIATPFEPMEFTPIANFFAGPPSLRSGDSRREGGFDWEKIKNNCHNFDILSESDDSVVPIEHAQKIAGALGVVPKILPGYSHFHNLDVDYLAGLIK